MEKYSKCEKPSKEIEVDDEGSESENENMGVGRTYECSYCKRGFTNAQALGGHMNIHRKDKAKARQQPQHVSIFSSSSSCNSYKPVVMEPPILSAYNSSSFAPAPPKGYPQGGYYPFANNPRFSSQPSIFEGNRTRLFGKYEDHHLGADLSLKISSSSSIEQYRQRDRPTIKNNNKEEDPYNDIDLELRLGYDP